MCFEDNSHSFSKISFIYFFFKTDLVMSVFYTYKEEHTFMYVKLGESEKEKKSLTGDRFSSSPLPLLSTPCILPQDPRCSVRPSSLGARGFSVQLWTLPPSAMIFLIVRYESAVQCRSHVIFTGWGNYWKLRIAALKTEGYFHDPISIRVGKLFMPSEDSVGKSIVNAHSF